MDSNHLLLASYGPAAIERMVHDHAMTVARAVLQRAAALFGHAAPPLLADYSILAAQVNLAAGVMSLNPAWAAASIARHCRDQVCTWSLLTYVLAHELAHILLGHASRRYPSEAHAQELDADDLAGWIAATLGHDINHVLPLVLSFPADQEHPTGALRALRVFCGYRRAHERGPAFLFARAA